MKVVRCYESFKVMFTGNNYFPPPPPLALSVVSMVLLSPQKTAEIRPAHSNKRLPDPRIFDQNANEFTLEAHLGVDPKRVFCVADTNMLIFKKPRSPNAKPRTA